MVRVYGTGIPPELEDGEALELKIGEAVDKYRKEFNCSRDTLLCVLEELVSFYKMKSVAHDYLHRDGHYQLKLFE